MMELWRGWAGVGVCDDCTACDTTACTDCREPQCVRLNREGPDQ